MPFPPPRIQPASTYRHHLVGEVGRPSTQVYLRAPVSFDLLPYLTGLSHPLYSTIGNVSWSMPPKEILGATRPRTYPSPPLLLPPRRLLLLFPSYPYGGVQQPGRYLLALLCALCLAFALLRSAPALFLLVLCFASLCFASLCSPRYLLVPYPTPSPPSLFLLSSACHGQARKKDKVR